jgi:hypothetical protein
MEMEMENNQWKKICKTELVGGNGTKGHGSLLDHNMRGQE